MGAAIGTLLQQTFQDFELIISDNDSTDATREICEAFAERDKRVKYFGQPHNLGAAPKFDFVLDLPSADYFR